MSVVAGIDIGNATTEVVLGRSSPHGVELVAAGRTATRRAKGSPESLAGAVALVRRLERQHAARVSACFVAPLRPVETVSGSLPEATPETGRLHVVAAGASTAGGQGIGVGRPVLLEAASAGEDRVVVLARRGTGFARVATALAPLAAAGRLAAVLMEDDEGVLVANRLPVRVPVVDEVDVDSLLSADRVAVEVAGEGRLLQALSDPLKLATALELSSEELGDAARLAPLLFDTGNAVVARTPRDGRDSRRDIAREGCIEVRDLGRLPFLVGHQHVGRGVVGTALGYALPPADDYRRVDDLWTVDIGATASAVQARRGAVRARPVTLAALQATAPPVDRSGELAVLMGVPVRAVAAEAVAARDGALTTPGAAPSSVVVDLGGGTVDIVSASSGPVVAAGAGDLLTCSVAALTGVTAAAAEWVKRGPAHRVEAPQILLAEDGSRHFLDRPVDPENVGSLVVQGPAGPLRFAATLAPGEWRALRRSLKVQLVGGNVARALRTLDESPGTVVVVGGLAGDEEILAAVTGALPAGTAVGRGNVGGVLGHRYAVGYGLVRLGIAEGPA